MMKMEIFKRTMYGIAYGGINSFIALTILMIVNVNPPVAIIWLYTFAGLILGIYFGLSSFIFEIETWSPLKKTVIHFSSSITCYFVVAILVGWVPFRIMAILITTVCFIFVYALFWSGYRLYYKKVESTMNESLFKK